MSIHRIDNQTTSFISSISGESVEIVSNDQPIGFDSLLNIDHITMHLEYSFCRRLPQYKFLDTKSGEKVLLIWNICKPRIVTYVSSTSPKQLFTVSRNFSSCSEFDVKILDPFKNDLMNLYEPLDCSNYFSCMHTVKIADPTGNTIGFIDQKSVWFNSQFIVRNMINGNTLKIVGPNCPTNICGHDEFKVRFDEKCNTIEFSIA